MVPTTFKNEQEILLRYKMGEKNKTGNWIYGSRFCPWGGRDWSLYWRKRRKSEKTQKENAPFNPSLRPSDIALFPSGVYDFLSCLKFPSLGSLPLGASLGGHTLSYLLQPLLDLLPICIEFLQAQQTQAASSAALSSQLPATWKCFRQPVPSGSSRPERHTSPHIQKPTWQTLPNPQSCSAPAAFWGLEGMRVIYRFDFLRL